MNIGIFLGEMQAGLGGGYTFQESIVSSLETVETDHNIFVFYYGMGKRAESTGKVTYVPLLDNYWVWGLVKKGLSLAAGKPSSLLHQAVARYYIDLVWFPSLQFMHLDIPYLCTVWDLEHRLHPFFPEVSASGAWQANERLFSSMISRAAYIIAGTEAGKRQIVDFYHPAEERVRVVPFPVSPFALKQQEQSAIVPDKYRIDGPYLFYPAQFWPHKNHVALLRALKILRNRYSLEMKVVFCGGDKGNLAYVKETARELGVEEHVRFLGFIAQEDLYSLYKNAFALVYPSMFGPDNLPPLEAFAIGCPVVTAKVAGAVEQFADAALLFDPRHEEEIAAAVFRLHGEAGLRETLICKGRERAGRWTVRDYVGEILAICDEFEPYRRCWSSKEEYVHL